MQRRQYNHRFCKKGADNWFIHATHASIQAAYPNWTFLNPLSKRPSPLPRDSRQLTTRLDKSDSMEMNTERVCGLTDIISGQFDEKDTRITLMVDIREHCDYWTLVLLAFRV